MESLIHVELDSEDYITRLEDRWCASTCPREKATLTTERRDAKPLPSGGIAKTLRGLNGKTMPSLIAVPKE